MVQDALISRPVIPTMSVKSVEAVRRAEVQLSKLPQIEIGIDNVLHAGLYARTCKIPAGTVITGAEIKIPTLLVIQGHCEIFTGESSVVLTGYNVIPAGAGRKQLIAAFEDTYITMLFASEAKTVEDAENEFTDEAHLLQSRKSGD